MVFMFNHFILLKGGYAHMVMHNPRSKEKIGKNIVANFGTTIYGDMLNFVNILEFELKIKKIL